jgi:putative endonuclease
MATHNVFGKQGEKAAIAYLIEKGYEILETNYRYLKAEIDIIARKELVLAVVEVKSRSSKNIKPIAETVTKKKINLLVMAADHFVTEHALNVEVRFDIVTIFKKTGNLEIEHLKSAYYHF